ncbi:MAG: class I SAM-dependent methyltransferase [Candidatus Lokiarchaeota archaeon]|nr:class I SAM-dependent methyltransferase [Candidatus Lokiarchaeota archaeon]
MKEEKPKYGWYVKNLIIVFNLVGLLGLTAFIYGFFIDGIIKIILLVSGIAIMLIFLWPGIGMVLMHLFLLGRISLVSKMKALDEIKTPRILDVGCGTGRTAIQIAKTLENGGHLYGIDIYSKLAIPGNALHTVINNARIEKVEEKTTFSYGTAIDIPFEDESFDIINASSVLHEVHDPNGQDKAIQEILRVLKPGGYFYLSEWNRSSWQCIGFGGICCFAFKKNDYWENLLKNHKFKIIKNEIIAGFGIFEAQK